VRQGVITARIAAHIGDMVKNNDRQRDLDMGRARRDLQWDRMYELAIDPVHAKSVRDSRSPSDEEACTMCGNYCALKIVKQSFNFER